MIALYFVVLGGIAAWVISKKQKDTEDYFLGGSNVGWFIKEQQKIFVMLY